MGYARPPAEVLECRRVGSSPQGRVGRHARSRYVIVSTSRTARATNTRPGNAAKRPHFTGSVRYVAPEHPDFDGAELAADTTADRAAVDLGAKYPGLIPFDRLAVRRLLDSLEAEVWYRCSQCRAALERLRCLCECGCRAHSHYGRCADCAHDRHAERSARPVPLAIRAAIAFGELPPRPGGRLADLLERVAEVGRS